MHPKVPQSYTCVFGTAVEIWGFSLLYLSFVMSMSYLHNNV